jgi:hypothetical protein
MGEILKFKGKRAKPVGCPKSGNLHPADIAQDRPPQAPALRASRRQPRSPLLRDTIRTLAFHAPKLKEMER